MPDTSRSANEAWVSRQALQDVYQKLLVMDLEFALDKKVEQELYVRALHLVILVNLSGNKFGILFLCVSVCRDIVNCHLSYSCQMCCNKGLRRKNMLLGV